MTGRRHTVAMFADSPAELSPSLWVNGSQLQPWLGEHGWDLELLPPFNGSVTRFLARARGLPSLATRLILPLKRRLQLRRVARSADIVIVHKCIAGMSDTPVLERRLRRLHPRIVFNFDDAVYERGIPHVDERIRLADAVWVGNPVLAEYSRQFCPDVRLIESAVDCDHYAAKTTYALGSPPRLVWSGTPFSLQYLRLLREPLRALRQRTDYVFNIICRERFTFADPAIPEEWTPFSRATELHGLQQADIALMPIDDGPYERAKENYKVKMYMACGLPVVCSPVGINTRFMADGERGFFASQPGDWTDCIERLIRDEALRSDCGRAGRRFVEERYAIPVIGCELLRLFESLMQRSIGR